MPTRPRTSAGRSTAWASSSARARRRRRAIGGAGAKKPSPPSGRGFLRTGAFVSPILALLRQPESEKDDREARELGEARHLAEHEIADQQREAWHQRREHRRAAGAEKGDRAGEQISGAGAGEHALNHQ